jgi:hypothetical protein
MTQNKLAARFETVDAEIENTEGGLSDFRSDVLPYISKGLS